MSKENPIIPNELAITFNNFNNSQFILQSNFYINQIKNESDINKRFILLKKYFAYSITKNIYEKMDLLYTTNMTYEQYRNMYVLIAKEIYLNILLAVETLVNERGIYSLDMSDLGITKNDLTEIKTNAKSSKNIEIINNHQQTNLNNNNNNPNEYSICESYILSKNNKF